MTHCMERAMHYLDNLDRDGVEVGVECYSWPNVWDNHWKRIIDKIEAMLPIEEPEEGE